MESRTRRNRRRRTKNTLAQGFYVLAILLSILVLVPRLLQTKTPPPAPRSAEGLVEPSEPEHEPEPEPEQEPETEPACLEPRHLTIPILMYHSVGYPCQNLRVTPEDLKEQMGVLRSMGFEAITLEEALAYVVGESMDIPSKPVVLTFDDAYDDFAENAMPVLEKYGYRATLFVIANYIGRTEHMTWDEVRAARDAGHEIGCHSMNHLDMSTLGALSLVTEIVHSRDRIEAEVGYRPLTFCYPSGRYNDTVVEMLEEEGYLGAVTTLPGWADTAQGFFDLRRIRIDGTASLSVFRNQMKVPGDD